MNTTLNTFLNALKEAGIYHTLANYRTGAISVIVEVPGEHWEVDFLEDGSIDVERFKSNGEIYDEKAFEELFTRYSDQPPLKKLRTGERKRANGKSKRHVDTHVVARSATKIQIPG